jgi:hypothetical protein
MSLGGGATNDGGEDRKAMARQFAVDRLAMVCMLIALPLAASAQQRCTRETLEVQKTSVNIDYCISGAARTIAGGEVLLPVQATYSASSGSFSRALQLHFVAGENVSRVLEALDLSRLGLTGTLHLTLTYSGGLVHVEGALLTPGAIAIK